MKKDKFHHARMDSWKNLRPSPKNWHEYDEWQKEHYRKYSVYKKRHVRAVMSKKWQRKAVWNDHYENRDRDSDLNHQ